MDGTRPERRADPSSLCYPSPPAGEKIPPPPSEPVLHVGRFAAESLGIIGVLSIPVGISAIVLGALITLACKMPMLPWGIAMILLLFSVTMLLLFTHACNSAEIKQKWAFRQAVGERDKGIRHIQSENARVMREYEKTCEAIKREYNQAFRDVTGHNDNAEIVNTAIDESQETIDGEIRKLRETLSGVYGLNIVFPKYHNLVAFASFYEYFQSGRCDALEGAHGAYDTFEREVRSDAMVSRLRDLSGGLAQIEKNQHKLYTEITAANNHAKALAEHVREKISLFSEKQSRLSGELAEARNDTKRLAAGMTGLDSHIKSLAAQSAKTNDYIASLERRLRSS